jgi:NAD+ synthase (glutamine-hydrolysing)
MKITLAQFNPTVGDIGGNIKALTVAFYEAHKEGSDLLVLPELYLCGYPPRDLLDRPWFIQDIMQGLERVQNLSRELPSTGILLGTPYPGRHPGKGLYNSALLIAGGEIVAVCHKSLLPSYDVFDEARYFDPASHIEPICFKNQVLGISICEDAWNDPALWPERRMYPLNPIQILADKGAQLFINISASPFHLGKEELRLQVLKSHTRKHRSSFIYLNQVGSNDELVFDGRSMVLDAQGRTLEVFPAFEEHLATIDTKHPSQPSPYYPQDPIHSTYGALVLGIRDYMKKCGFTKAVLGLSGGIDSAVTACLACAAVGPANVLGISMPSSHSSRGSVEDSRLLARNLGIKYKVIPIAGLYQAYIDTLNPHFKNRSADTTEENLQARIRGNLLMAFSNKYAYLLLSTGNKSELALGYCTLYGDMSGGLSVLADVPKTLVYQLSHYINRDREIIPTQIISKPPSAELRPGQLDQDELPPYEVLDRILHYYIEDSLSVPDLIHMGFDREMVKWIVKKVDGNEYKRRQAAPALKVTGKAFGMGRRMPMAAKIDSGDGSYLSTY